MKKVFALMLFVSIFNSCDDGDIIIENIDFANVTAAKCGTDDLIYKIANNEALILKIPATTGTFKNDATILNEPRIDLIGGDISLVYRTYNGPVSKNSICDSPAPIAPLPTAEWIATDGVIETTTTPIYSVPDVITGQIKITQYNHYISIRNLRFRKSDGTEQNYPVFAFGVYSTAPLPLNFAFTPTQAKLCPSKTTIYNAINQGTEGFFIKNIDYDTLFSTANPGVPKTALLGSTQNKLIYRSFASSLPNGGNENYFCSDSNVPVPLEEWIGVDGVAGISGIIEVTSTQNTPGNFQHFIRLKNVTLKRGNTSYYFGDDYLFGDLTLPE